MNPRPFDKVHGGGKISGDEKVTDRRKWCGLVWDLERSNSFIRIYPEHQRPRSKNRYKHLLRLIGPMTMLIAIHERLSHVGELIQRSGFSPVHPNISMSSLAGSGDLCVKVLALWSRGHGFESGLRHLVYKVHFWKSLLTNPSLTSLCPVNALGSEIVVVFRE